MNKLILKSSQIEGELNWGVKVFPTNSNLLYLASVQLPLPELTWVEPEWVEPPIRSPADLEKYVQLTADRAKALTFKTHDEALIEAIKISEFDVPADVFSIHPLDAESEILGCKAGQ